MQQQRAMGARQLRQKIKRLDAEKPMHKELEKALQEGVGFRNAWYESQKEHWLGWLAEYDGPGAYGRQTGKPRDAKYIYNHIQCAPMLFWLGEAVEIPAETLGLAFGAVVASPKRNASQCSAFRKLVPWEAIDALLSERGKGRILSRVRALISA